MTVTSIEKEDGTWWYLCPLCGQDTGYMGNPRIKDFGPMTVEERTARICPKVQFEFDILCCSCGTKMILRRYTVTVII